MDQIDFILSMLPEKLSKPLKNMDKNILKKLNEIRIRRNNYIIVVIRNTSYFIDVEGNIFDCPNYSTLICDSDLFDETFMMLCDYSIYNNMDTLSNGYLTLSNGSRIGVSSTIINSNNSVKDVTSLNIRIPRQVVGCGRGILDFLYVNAFPSIIVCGGPNSGKTTLLRDIARGLSSGFNNQYKKIVFVDERNEFAGKQNKNITLDIGINTDVITSFSKSKGIEIATRTLSPEMIVCDEISTIEELESIKYSFSTGVKFAVSVHAGTKDDLLKKQILIDLLNTGEFEYLIWLNKYTYKPEIIDGMDILNEIFRRNNASSFNNPNRI